MLLAPPLVVPPPVLLAPPVLVAGGRASTGGNPAAAAAAPYSPQALCDRGLRLPWPPSYLIGRATTLLNAPPASVVICTRDRTERLAAGDSATFAGDVAHGYAAAPDATTPARFALTVFEPNVGGGHS